MHEIQVVPVDLVKLAAEPTPSAAVIGLMMAANDIALANQGLGWARVMEPDYARLGGAMYFIRLQCGHLVEALDLIQEILADRELHARLSHLPEFARDAFDTLRCCLPGGADRTRFEKYALSLRNRTIFHYDRSLVRRAIALRAEGTAHGAKITQGDHISLWRFNVADDLHDTIACRLLWAIPREANLRQAADEVADYIQNLCKAFLDFVGSYVFAYVAEKAAPGSQ